MGLIGPTGERQYGFPTPQLELGDDEDVDKKMILKKVNLPNSIAWKYYNQVVGTYKKALLSN